MPHFPKPFYRASRDLYYVQLNGKQINLGRNKDEAYKKYHQLLAAPAESQPIVQPDNTLVVILCDQFLGWVEKHRAPATYGWYLQRLQCFATAYPKLLIRELKPYHVQQWVDAMDIGRTTRRNYIRAIKRAIKWSLQQGYISKNPIADFEAPSADRREDTVSKEQFEKVVAAVPDEGFKELLIVSYETGCRPQEIRAIEARHFDASRKIWLFPKSEAKLKRNARVVYLTDRATEICSHRASKYPDGPIFRNANGDPWKNYAVQCAIRRGRIRLGKQAMKEQGIEISEKEIKSKIKLLSPTKTRKGELVEKTLAQLRHEAKRKLIEKKAVRMVPAFCLYVLRHSFATRALIKGVDSTAVSTLLGHEDCSTLAKVYQHLSSNPEFLLRETSRISS